MWKLYLTQCSRLPWPQRDILPKERAEQRQPVIHQLKKNSKNPNRSLNQFDGPPCQCPWQKAWRPGRGAGTRPTGSPGFLTASRSPELSCNVPWIMNHEQWIMNWQISKQLFPNWKPVAILEEVQAEECKAKRQRLQAWDSTHALSTSEPAES